MEVEQLLRFCFYSYFKEKKDACFFFLKIKRLFDCGIYILPCLANTGLKKNIDTIKKLQLAFYGQLNPQRYLEFFFFNPLKFKYLLTYLEVNAKYKIRFLLRLKCGKLIKHL